MESYQIGKDVTALQSVLSSLSTVVNNQAKVLQETRDALEKLAARQGFEYDENKKEWVKNERTS